MVKITADQRLRFSQLVFPRFLASYVEELEEVFCSDPSLHNHRHNHVNNHVNNTVNNNTVNNQLLPSPLVQHASEEHAAAAAVVASYSMPGSLHVMFGDNHNHTDDDDVVVTEDLMQRYCRAVGPWLDEEIIFFNMTADQPQQARLVHLLLVEYAPRVRCVKLDQCDVTDATTTTLAQLIRQQQQQPTAELGPRVESSSPQRHAATTTIAAARPFSRLELHTCPLVGSLDTFVDLVSGALRHVGDQGSLRELSFWTNDPRTLSAVQAVITACTTLLTVEWIDLRSNWPTTLGWNAVLACLTAVAQHPHVDTFRCAALGRNPRLFGQLLAILVQTESRLARVDWATVRRRQTGHIDPASWLPWLPRLRYLRQVTDWRVSQRDPHLESLYHTLRRNTSLVEEPNLVVVHTTSNNNNNNNDNNDNGAFSSSTSVNLWNRRLERVRQRNVRIAQCQSSSNNNDVSPRLWPRILERLQDYNDDPRREDEEQQYFDTADCLDPTPVFLFVRWKLPSRTLWDEFR